MTIAVPLAQGATTDAVRASKCPSPRSAPVRVGVVGIGQWGSNLVRAFSTTPSARLVAACDIDDARLTTLPPWVRRSVSISAMLADGDLDAVAIATPPRTHARIAVAALEAGKDVFVEKPMALSVDEAIRIAHAVRETGRRLMVGLILQFHPAVTTLLEWARSGVLGDITRIVAVRGSRRAPSDDHPMWWSLAPHDVSLGISLCRGPVRTVQVTAESHPALSMRATMEFGGGGAVLHLTLLANERRRTVTVVGTRATAVFDDLDEASPLRLFAADDAPGTEATGGVPVGRPLALVGRTEDEPLLLEVRCFVDRLIDERPFMTDLGHATDVVAALATGACSLDQGGVRCEVVRWR